MPFAVVITTIQSPTPGVRAIAEGLTAVGGELILVGDRKTPSDFGTEGSIAISIEEQSELPFATARAVPENSYARKMVGYLMAIQRGHEWIRETDDDNQPYESFFDPVPQSITARVAWGSRWVNPYAWFTDRFVWPRGYPLDEVHNEFQRAKEFTEVAAPFILQGLADGDPDVDAVFRLTTPDLEPITFRRDEPLAIPKTSWAPFNSQATTWPKVLFPLLYLPATCSFRMTDIWRSFIAQRVMRDHGGTVVFTAATVHQDRNAHDLMRDFSDEIEGYLGYHEFVRALDELTGLASISLSLGLRRAYERLVAANFFQETELHILDAWLSDMKNLGVDTP